MARICHPTRWGGRLDYHPPLTKSMKGPVCSARPHLQADAACLLRLGRCALELLGLMVAAGEDGRKRYTSVVKYTSPPTFTLSNNICV